jgi:type I restriction enzyme, S subunit
MKQDNHLQINTPALRFPLFTEGWQFEKVGELCDSIVPGRNKPTNFEGDIPWITTPDIEHNGIIMFSKKGLNISRNEAKKVGSKLVPINSIVISCVGDLGLAAIAGKEIVINQQLHAFIPKERIEYRFLLCQLNLQKKYMDKVATKTAVPYMNKDNCNSIPISFPTLPEQQKIAAFFTAIDKKLSGLKEKRRLLEQYKKGVMQQLFSQALRFKNTEGGDFEEWEVRKLGEIAKRKTLKNKDNNTNVLTISAQFGLISQLEFFNKSVSAKDVTGYYLLEKGDFAYNKSYSNGYPMGAIKCLNKYDKGVVSTLYICFTFNENINLSFMEQYFEAGIHNTEIEKVAQEGARNHGLLNIGLEDFFNIEFPIPSLAEQTQIANYLSALDEKIKNTEGVIGQMETWKKGLLQQMFV